MTSEVTLALSDGEMRARMANGWKAGAPETVCGNGSRREYSHKAINALPAWLERFGIKSLNDAGAGDGYFASGIALGQVEYRPFDLIPRKEGVTEIDFTKEPLPEADAILCRMALNHLDEQRVLMALEQFRKSAKFLIATQFTGENLPKRSPQFTRFDLRIAPFNLGEPLASVQDSAEEICSLAVWKL